MQKNLDFNIERVLKQNDLVQYNILMMLKEKSNKVSGQIERYKRIKRQKKRENDIQMNWLNVKIGKASIDYQQYLALLNSIIDQKELKNFKKRTDLRKAELDEFEVKDDDFDNIERYYTKE